MIAGAKEDDYEAEEEPSRARAEEPAPTESSTKKEEAGNEAEEERRVSDIGSISFVSCATGEDAMTSLGGNQEAEEGNYICPYFCSCFFVFYFIFQFFFVYFFQRARQD